MKRNNHCCKSLHAGISFLGIGAWLMLVGISLITASLAYDPAIHGAKMELFRLLWIGVITSMLWLRIFSLQRHTMMSPRFKRMPVLGRFACLMILMLLPPVPEVMGIAKLGFRQSVVVQNFWCDAPDIEVDAMKLAENVRSRYFAKAEHGGFELLIATNVGLVTVLLQESRIYAFLLEEQWEAATPFGLPKGGTEWKMEESQTGDRALVWEVQYAPCCQSVTAGRLEKELSELLVDALDQISSIAG